MRLPLKKERKTKNGIKGNEFDPLDEEIKRRAQRHKLEMDSQTAVQIVE